MKMPLRGQMLRLGSACLFTALLSPAMADLAPGTVAVYSDGTAQRLISSEAGRQVWEDQRLRRYTLSDNPLLPPLAREQRLGGVDYRNTLRTGRPDELLDSEPGEEREFSVWRSDRLGNRSPRNYACRYEGEREAEVLGKREPLKRYFCERFTIHHKLWTRTVKETLRLDYSPRLQLLVDVQRTKKGETRRRSLDALIEADSYSYRDVRKLLAKADDK